MIIEQIYTDCLSQASYFIESNGESAVIDPLRDIGVYLKKAEKRNSKIKYIFQTHFHADFISGHLNLSKKSKAPIVYGPNADPKYDCIISEDMQSFIIGDVKIQVIHTPGHTLESSSFLLIDQYNNQHSIFTGDTLFLGDVGIPDVAQRYQGISKEKLAEMLYESINNRIKPLNDDIIIYPGHGAGSACGKNMMKETVDTLSNQKKVNYSLNGTLSKSEFVKELTTNLPVPPHYFPSNVKLNREGYLGIDEILFKNFKNLKANYVNEKIKNSDVIVLDTRKSSEYSSEHIPGSIFIGLDGRFAPWVGEILKNINQEIILIVEKGREKEALTRLSRVGFDNCLGFLEYGLESWIENGFETQSIKNISPDKFVNIINDVKVLDVRNESEINSSSLNNSIKIPLKTLEFNLNKLDQNNKYYIHCAGGYRSMIAASIMKKNGFNNLVNVSQGYSAIKKCLINI